MKKTHVYDIIYAEARLSQFFGLRPFRTMRDCVIDGFAKMPLQASIFASWYNIYKKVRKPQRGVVQSEEHPRRHYLKECVRSSARADCKLPQTTKGPNNADIWGLVKCADCGWAMSFGTNKQNTKPYSYFNCTSYSQFGKKHATCTAHYIRYDTLYTYVHVRLMYWWQQAQADEEMLIERILKAGDIDKLTAKLPAKHQSVIDAEKWIASIKKCSSPTELTADLLNSLIEKIGRGKRVR